ncbi:hypothetical protein MKX01_030799 [Papaver californicum]|nr:hypothetical protein MKX01_030799 [Papaver californicum]
MPNPLRKSGSSLSGSKNSSSSSEKGSSSSLDTKNVKQGKKKKKSGSLCSNGGQKAKKLSAAKYRAILLKNQGREDKDEKSDRKKKKELIAGPKVGNDLAPGVKGAGGSMEIEDGGGHCSESKLKGVGEGSFEMDVSMKEGEIRVDNIVPLEPEENGENLSAKVCGGGGGVSEECCKDVQPRDSAEMASDDNVCLICKLGGSTETLLCCDEKGCKKNYHLKCVDPPLKGVPPGDWYCFSCVKKNIESGVLFLPGAVESNLDAIEVELADSEGVDTTKNSLCNKIDFNDSVEKLKEKPVRGVASDSKFVEYWVPAQLSDVQLEQYCDILLSNSILLRSCSKTETVEALRDVLISTRKCCDHPYFVNPSLQKMLTNGLPEAEYLNVGIKASGKLQILDTILSETEKQGLRVLIIFQSNVGSSGISLGDVLDDVVRQRCGVDSYERVDCGLIVPNSQFSKMKQTAMTKFNDKETGRIVFLLDRRACHSSIKLSSVDIVILYDSDLNPYNDLKVLQKITIDPRHEQLKVFRLYSFCTLEEMVLIHSKQDVTVDNNVQNLNHSAIHLLLRWGASYLFKQLVEFHSSSPSFGSIFSSEHLMKELFSPLPQDAGIPSTINSSIVVKVNQTGGAYSRDVSLPGELEMQSVDEELPHVFWTKLLNRKIPNWRYLPAASSLQRIRKRVQYSEGSLKKADLDNDDVIKKKRKVLTGTIDAGVQKPVVEDKTEVSGVNKEGASGTPAGDCSQFFRRPVVPIGATRFRKANEICRVPAACLGKFVKISVQQELEGEIRESHQSCQTVLPPPSEPPCPEPLVEDQVELVNNSASGSTSQPDIQLNDGIQFEAPRPEPPVEDQVELVNKSASGSASQPDILLDIGIQLGHITPQQAEYPTQQPATKEHAKLPSHDVVVPLQPVLQLPMSIDRSLGGSGTRVSDSRSMGGVPNSINHPRRSAPETSELPSPNDGLQDTMLQQPVMINRCVGGSVTRVSDFRSLGVVPECNSHPLQIAPLTSSQTSQTLLQDDPLLHELSRIRQEREQVVKLHEELKLRIRYDYYKEVQETNKKYGKLHHDNDTALAQKKKTLHTVHNIFLMNGMLAECFRDKML